MTLEVHEQTDDWRQRKPRKPRERILDAARELFLAHGYTAISVEQIAAHADVVPATVYNHFGTKAAIAAYLFQDAFAAVQNAAEVDIAARIPLEQAVHRHLDRFAQLAIDEPRLVDVFLRGILETGLKGGIPEPAMNPRMIVPLHVPLSAILQAGKERGEIPAQVDALDAATMAINPFIVKLLAGHEPMQAAHTVADLLLYGVSGQPRQQKG